MQLGETFNLNDLPQDSGAIEPVPAGWYTATIVSAEIRNTKSGTGRYIAIRFDITGPTHEGRVVWHNLNVRNDSAKAEEIGQQQLHSIMAAMGLTSVSDTDQLIGGNMQIKVSIRRSEEYGDRNEVKGFKALAGAAAAKPDDIPLPGEGDQQSASAPPPWAS